MLTRSARAFDSRLAPARSSHARAVSNYIFRREFPLGVEDRVLRERWEFAVRHSGLNTVRHIDSSVVSISVYAAMGSATACFVGYMLYVMMVCRSGPEPQPFHARLPC